MGGTATTQHFHTMIITISDFRCFFAPTKAFFRILNIYETKVHKYWSDKVYHTKSQTYNENQTLI